MFEALEREIKEALAAVEKQVHNCVLRVDTLEKRNVKEDRGDFLPAQHPIGASHEQLEAQIKEQDHYIQLLRNELTEKGGGRDQHAKLAQQNWLYRKERNELKQKLKEATDENVNLSDELRHIQRRVHDHLDTEG